MDGALLPEGLPDGVALGILDGITDGSRLGVMDGESDGSLLGIREGISDGMVDGAPLSEGIADGVVEGSFEGSVEEVGAGELFGSCEEENTIWIRNMDSLGKPKIEHIQTLSCRILFVSLFLNKYDML